MSRHLLLWVVLCYNLFLLAVVAVALRRLRRAAYPAVHVAVSAVVLLALAWLTAIVTPLNGFGRIRLLTWAAFLHAPALFLGSGLLIRRRRRALAYACVGVTIAILIVAGDAFLIEPRWLEVSHTTLRSARLSAPARIAVIADLQTDAPGAYEARALRLAQTENPDLILFAGDYIQQAAPAAYAGDVDSLNAILRGAELRAPLGVYAVAGNVDWVAQWGRIFAGASVQLFTATTTIDLGPLVLTGLTFEDSANTELTVGAEEKYHIVLGHTPNFSRGAVNADLLIAGHTHGGQVRLPLLGPPMILAAVPRAWAAGVHEIAPGKILAVSRGVGMERDQAPRLRFLCRPDIMILDLLPAE